VDASATASHQVEPIERETIKKVTWRLIPLLMLGYFCAYLDRSNVGMAATTMLKDLQFNNAVFGFGAGLFFWGYFLAEIPSNLILSKVGARRWIARILISWGIVASLTAFVWSEWSFYINRIALGLGEAGFYPGVVLYLIWWFPSAYRTRMMSWFQSASVISLFIGPPMGTMLMWMDGVAGMAGWQWLYLMEGLPPIITGIITWKLLTDRPKDAMWLTQEQRTWLQDRLDSEHAVKESIRTYSMRDAFLDKKIWLLTLAYFGQNVSGYGLVFFLPLIVKGLGVSQDWVGVVSAIPWLCAFVAMIAFGYHSDYTGERTWHVVTACLLCAVGLTACIVIGTEHPMITMVAICIAVAGQKSISALFWSIPSAMLTGVAAAAGLAMINAIGNLGGSLGPTVYGLVKDATGSTNLGLLCLAIAPVVSAISMILVGHDRRLEGIPRL
jgi:ACS family tartrate transporter-like MFS transporter